LTLSAVAALGVLIASTGASAQSQDNDVKIYTGHFAYGIEVSSFTPCGSDVELWLSEGSIYYEDLVSEYLQMTNEPYDMVLLQVEGQRRGVDGGGFANEYDDVLDVTGVIEMRLPTPADCH